MASDAIVEALGGQAVDDLYNVPPSNAKRVLHPTQIGDGLAGPRNVQHLQIFRDALPIAADQLAFQAALGMEVTARHRAGRYFLLNPDMTAGGAGLDASLPGLPLHAGLPGPTPFSPGQLSAWHHGIRPAEVLAPAQTVYYTATPDVGYDW